MDLTSHIDSLRQDLAAAAEAAAPETRQAIERLLFALNPAMRLALMDAIGQAAAEITARMPSGGVEVRLNGRELDFVVEALAAPGAALPVVAADEAEGDGGLARISLRMPETMKTKAEELAARSGQSLNNWLVGVVRTATRSDGPGADLLAPGEPSSGSRRGNRRMTGWV